MKWVISLLISKCQRSGIPVLQSRENLLFVAAGQQKGEGLSELEILLLDIVESLLQILIVIKHILLIMLLVLNLVHSNH